ncbi:MAG: ABC transporter permease [Actinomycetota bacterium]
MMPGLRPKQDNRAAAGIIQRCISGIERLWLKLWRGKPPGAGVLGIAAAVTFMVALPVMLVVARGAQSGKGRWAGLLDSRIPLLLSNTLSLVVLVTVLSTVLGVTLAWLAVRTDLPGKRWWQWILAFPLVIPPYVGAISYVMVLGPTGWIRDLAGRTIFPIYSLWGVVFILTIFTYPYVFLVISAALKRMNYNYEEAALASGLSYREVFFKVVLPVLRPAVGAGSILVSLYVLSDFGAVSMLRYTTFTTAIYHQMGSYDQEGAAILSLVLIFIALGFIWFEAKTREKKQFSYPRGNSRKPPAVELGAWKIPAFFLVMLVLFLVLVLPLGVLLYWSWYGISREALDYRILGFAANSLYTAGLVALICMFLSLPVVYLKSRHPSAVSSFIDKLAYSGYNLPGVIVALGIIFLFSRFIPFLYGTVVLLVIAYIIRFLPHSMQAQGAGLSMVSKNIDEAGRSLGYPGWKVMFKVILPVIRPSVMAGGALVFVSAVKELQATLLLRPPGFDTLAVRIWIDASEGFYHTAAPAALLIIFISFIPLKWMLSTR